MFLPHFCSGADDHFEPLTDPVAASRYYSLIKSSSTFNQEQSYDSYDRFFSKAKADYQAGYFTENTESMIIESMMSRDPKMQKLIHEFFEVEDYFTLRDRMIGSGAIGGKACGMLLARKIVEKKLDGYHKHAEQHDSFYIGSDIFYTYIVSNGCWNLRIEQRTSEGYMEKAEELKQGLLHGSFSPATREQFRNMLEYYGQNPIIVRSSSLLEDGFGNAFAGKYALTPRCALATQDRWIPLPWNTAATAASTTRMSRWRSWCSASPALTTVPILCHVPPA